MANEITELEVGKKYLLRTSDWDGNFNPVKHWIKVTWDGQFLKDDTDFSWNEWLYPDYSDIFPIDFDSEKV